MNKNKSINLCFALFCSVFASQVQAILLTLDNLPSNLKDAAMPVYEEQGFRLDIAYTNRFHVMDTDGSLVDANSARASGWGADNRFLQTSKTDSIFTLSAIDGQAFDFVSVDVGRYNNSGLLGPNWLLKAYDNNNQQVGNDVALTSAGTINLSITNIHRLEFTQPQNMNSAFDNLLVRSSQNQEEQAPWQDIPEPSVIAAWLTGLLLLSRSMREK